VRPLIPDEGTTLITLLAFIAGVLAIEVHGTFLSRLAINFTIPPGWVHSHGVRAGFVWGTALGLGFVTQARFAVFQASLIAAVVQPDPAVAFASGVVFALVRAVTGVVPAARRAALEAVGRLVIPGTAPVLARSYGVVAGRAVSLASLTLALAALSTAAVVAR